MHLSNLNPAEIIAAWASLIAVLSLANKFLVGRVSPNVERVISAIISLPAGHIANAIEDVETLLRDLGIMPPNPPAPPAPPAVTVGPDMLPGGGAPQAPKPPAPSAMRGRIGFGGRLGVAALALIIGASTIGVGAELLDACTPAQQAELDSIETVVMTDLAANKTRAQIEADIVSLVCGDSGACVDAGVLLEDALALLVAEGANISPSVVIRAKAMRARGDQ